MTLAVGSGCGTDFLTRPGGGGGAPPSSGGASSSGGSLGCCPGQGGAKNGSGGVNATGGEKGSSGGAIATGGTFFEGECLGSERYCVVDWLGVWDESGFVQGSPAESRFEKVGGIASNETTLYVTHGHAISSIDRVSGVSTLLAGSVNSGYADARGGAARFSSPSGILLFEGFLYVSDTKNRVVRRVEVSTGQVTTYLKTLVSGPAGLEILPAEGSEPNYLLIADETLHIILRVEIADKAPVPGVLTGTFGQSGSNSVLLDRPFGLARLGTQLFITERGNQSVRTIDLAKTAPISLVTQWGNGQAGFMAGKGIGAQLRDPTGIGVFLDQIYVVDSANNVIRAGAEGGSLLSIAGEPEVSGHQGGVGKEARFQSPQLLHITLDGVLFVAEQAVIRRVTIQ